MVYYVRPQVRVAEQGELLGYTTKTQKWAEHNSKNQKD